MLYLVSLNHFVNDGSVYLLSSLFPVVVAVFGFSALQLGVIVSIGYLVSVVLQPLVGRYGEGRPPRDMLAAGILVEVAAVFSFVFAQGFYAVLLSVVVLRVGSSFYHPVGVSAVSAAYDGSLLDSAMGFQSAFGNLGILAVFIVSAPLYVAFGWRTVFVTFGLLGMLDVALTLLLFGSGGRSQPRAPGQTQRTAGSPWGVPMFFLTVVFISGGAYATILNFANIFLQNGGAGVVIADAMVAVWVASAFVGAFLVGRLTAKMRRDLLLPSAYFVSALTILLAAALYRNAALEILMLAANGFALSAIYPIIYSSLSDHISGTSSERGSPFGIIFSAQTVGGAVMGILSGYLSGVLGLSTVFLTVAGLLSLGGVLALYWSLVSRHRRPERSELTPGSRRSYDTTSFVC